MSVLAVSTHLVPHQPQVAPHTPDASLYSIVWNFGHLHHLKKLFIKNKPETHLNAKFEVFSSCPAWPCPALLERPRVGWGGARRARGPRAAALQEEEEEATSHGKSL